jgi:hypothetical protein
LLLILRHGLLLTAAGLLAGVIAARALTGPAASALACYAAARRVARIDLAAAMRTE